MLPFVSCHMKVNAEVTHSHVKTRSMQGLVFVQTFEICLRNFYFERGEVGLKRTIADL